MTVTPVRVRDHDDGLATDVVRIVGYRTRCRCGWKSPSRPTVRDARADYADHARWTHNRRG